jgi:hypothetical protein
VAAGKCHNQAFKSIKNKSTKFKAIAYDAADCKPQMEGEPGFSPGCCFAGYDPGKEEKDVGFEAKSLEIFEPSS